MCGIVGYVGDQEASAVLLDALKRLEYRGYDSSGVAVLDSREKDAPILVQKRSGYISQLESSIENIGSHTGISHTRWATHGPPTEINAHPHTDEHGSIAVVHNGIIDNHLSLKQELKKKGHEFVTQTDSEVIPHLIAEEYKTCEGDLMKAVRSAINSK